VPSLYALQIDLSLSVADIQKNATSVVASVNAAQAAALKHSFEGFNVDSARAEWRVSDKLLVVFA
jgi:hypothetical protein